MKEHQKNMATNNAITKTTTDAKPSLEEINMLVQLTNEYYNIFSANSNLIEILNKNLKPCSLLLLELCCIPFQKCKVVTKTYKSADARKYHWEWGIASSKEVVEFKLPDIMLKTETEYKKFIECINNSEIKDFYIRHWYGDIVEHYDTNTESIRVDNMDLVYKDKNEKLTNEKLSFLQDMFKLFIRKNIIDINLPISDNLELNKQAAYNAFLFLFRCLSIQELIKRFNTDELFKINNDSVLTKSENINLTLSNYKENIINNMRSSIMKCDEKNLQFWFAVLNYCEKPISTPFFKLYYQEEDNAARIVQEIKDSVQFESLKNGSLKNTKTYTMLEIDKMTPAQFENFVTELFRGFGYKAETTKLSGDQGIDVVAKKGNQILAIQAKHYNQAVGNHAIMEVVGGAKFYNATICYVVTNNYFTKSAKELAAANNVILWDRDKLIEKLSEI